MNTQGAEGILGGEDGGKRTVHAEVPQADFAISTTGDKLAQSTTLHVNVRDPLFVLPPNFDHGGGWLEALVEDSDGTVAETRNKDVTRYLIRGQGCNT